MSNLQLSLKKQWFELTKSGVKTEDYREINPYWLKRLTNVEYVQPRGNIVKSEEEIYSLFTSDKVISFVSENPKVFNSNIMTLGYPKSTDYERILKLEHKGIEIREGNPEWGAVPGRKYFVILHGSFLK